MRRKLAVMSGGFALIVGFAAYVASPFLAAWNLREAIRTGQTAAIERRVAWDTVRASLKTSIARHADLVPIVKATGERIRPTLWQRVKRVFGASMLDRFIETKITPVGLHKLYLERQIKTRQETTTSDPTDLAANANAHDWRRELRSFARRLVHARFLDLTTVQIQIADPIHHDRHYRGTMELINITWTLTRLEVVRAHRV